MSHSLSFGNADAALIVASSAPLADAVATVAGNATKTIYDIEGAIEQAKSIEGVRGVLITLELTERWRRVGKRLITLKE